MLIVNPIYDQAFKYMMDNEEVAKKVISIIIEKKVLKIQSKPQEVKVMDKKRNIPLSRFDFKAVIENEQGEMVNMLIEIQKSNKPDPVMRFRRYLGKNYIRKETIINELGVEKKVVLPISTIYILGYNLAEYDTPGILVNNQVIDATTKKEIEHKNEFVKLLTHPSYILQTKRLRKERKTKLEKFLAIFDQTKKTDDDFLLDLDDELELDTDISLITTYLNRGTLDEQLLNQLELEEDVEEEFLKMETELAETKKRELEIIKQKKEAQKREVEAQKREQDAIKQKNEAQKKIINLARLLKDLQVPIEQIIAQTELSREEIEEL